MTSGVLTSAQPLIALLHEDDPEVLNHALKLINANMNIFWAELSPQLPLLEDLAEAKALYSEEAALCAAHVYHHLGSHANALRIALAAPSLIDLSKGSTDSFTASIISSSIEQYAAHQTAAYLAKEETLRREAREKGDDISQFIFNSTSSKLTKAADTEMTSVTSSPPTTFDPRTEKIVLEVINSAVAMGDQIPALGLALNCHRLDIIRKIIIESNNPEELLAFLFAASRSASPRSFARELNLLLVDLYRCHPSRSVRRNRASPRYSPRYSPRHTSAISECSDVPALVSCYYALEDASSIADLLNSLMDSGNDMDFLLALQTAFDLCELQDIRLLSSVLELVFPDGTPVKPDPDRPASSYKDTPAYRDYSLGLALSGSTSSSLQISFLVRRNKTDLKCMDILRSNTEKHIAILQGSLFTAHGLLTCGTAMDKFLRLNVDWLGKSTGWAKFQAIAGLGLVHRANPKIREILSTYLPSEDATITASGPNEFQEAGAVFALGLASSTHSSSASHVASLRDILSRANAAPATILQHGAAFGLGLSAVASRDANILEDLTTLQATGEAIPGEAAGYAIGLTSLGSHNWVLCADTLATIRENAHEKTRRGGAIGLAMIAFGATDAANPMANDMLSDADPAIRLGGIWTIGMAYAGTSDPDALGRLLSAAVSDVDDDIRRAAPIAVGFVLANQPEKVPAMLALLSQSYSLHIRYGVAMAIGIACAGRGLEIPQAHEIVNGLLSDKSDLVRQGAYIAMALLLHNLNDPELALREAEDFAAKKLERAEKTEKAEKNEMTDVAGVVSVASKTTSKTDKTDKTDKAEKTVKKNIGKVEKFRSMLYANVTRRGDVVTKIGMITAAGILDIAGRNGHISLLSPAGSTRAVAAAGMLLFAQMWHWHFATPCIALACTPAYLVGLDKALRAPLNWSVVVKLPAVALSYPLLMKETEKTATKGKVSNALSISKVRAKGSALRMGLKREASDLSSQLIRSQSTQSVQSLSAKEKVEKDKKNAEKEKAESDAYADEAKLRVCVLTNPFRFLRSMEGKIVLGAESSVRYVPIRDISHPRGSVVMLKDQTPSVPTAVYAPIPVVSVSPDVDSTEPSVPTPFALSSLGLNPSQVGLPEDSTTTESTDSTTNTSTSATTNADASTDANTNTNTNANSGGAGGESSMNDETTEESNPNPTADNTNPTDATGDKKDDTKE